MVNEIIYIKGGPGSGRYPKGSGDYKKFAGAKDLDMFFDENNSYIDSLDSEQYDTLVDYTGSGYVYINEALRNPDNASEEDTTACNVLSSIFTEKTELKDDITVVRTFGRHIEEIKDLEIGDEFTDNGFCSTRGLIQGNLTENIEIRVPKGTRALYLENITETPGEFEVLLNAGTKFQVIDKDENNYPILMVVGQE